MTKENAPATNHESAKDRPHSSAVSTASEAFRQKLIKDLFPKKTTACFECGTKLTNSNRKRIVLFHRLPEGVAASGYQVCKPCSVLMQAGELQKLPKINSDIMAARFGVIGANVECAGGMQ